MGARAKGLFSTTKIQENYRTNSPDRESKIATLSAIIDLRPRLKVYIDTIPTRGQLEQVKQDKQHDGVIVLFDPLEGNDTEPKSIIERRPFLELCNGRLPDELDMRKKAKIHSRDGLLIIFKRLNDEEKERIYNTSDMTVE